VQSHCYRHPVNLTHCAPQQVSYALTDIRIRFKIIVWVTHVYHRVISIGGGKKVNLDNLNDCLQKKKKRKEILCLED
jgi:hypothetical protein